jgi:hypothetical protein
LTYNNKQYQYKKRNIEVIIIRKEGLMKLLFTIFLASIVAISLIGCGTPKSCMADCDKAYNSCNASVEAKYPVMKRMKDRKVTTAYVIDKNGCVVRYSGCKAKCAPKK